MLTSRRRLLRIYYFVLFSALGAFLPFFPTWLRARGMSGFELSSIMATGPFLGIVSPIVFALLADAFGLRGSLLRLTVGGALVSMTAIALVSSSGRTPRFGVLFALVAVFAFFRSPSVSVADATALENPDSYGRTRLFGSLGFAAMVAFAAEFVDLERGASLPALIAAALFATFLVTTTLPGKGVRPASPVAHGAMSLFRDLDFVLFLGCAFAWYAAQVSYDLCFSMRVLDLGGTHAEAGRCWAFGVVAEVLLMSAAPHLFARAKVNRLLSIGLVATALRFAILSHVRSLDAVFLLQPLHALSFALVWLASLEFVKARAPSSVLATAQGSFSAATALGSVTGMFLWGPLYARSGGDAVFSNAAVVAAVGAALALYLDVRSKSAVRKSAPATTQLGPSS